jgi:hypothetical protein
MAWLLRKIDTLVAAVLAALCGTGLSQAQAFAQQYLQRLGGHRDEAERAWHVVQNSIGPDADATGQRVVAEAQARFQDLAQAYDAIHDSAPLLKPMALIRHIDPDIASRALTDFQPALPLDAASLTYAIAGMLLALLLYDLVKWPCAALFRPSRQRYGSGLGVPERRRGPRGPY